MELIAVGIITILYFSFALLKEKIEAGLPIKVCAICFAVPLTWMPLLALDILNIIEIDDVLLGVLMGGSVVGLMYRMEMNFKDGNLQNFWLIRILEITGGFLAVYYLIKQEFENFVFVLIIYAVLAGITLLIISNERKDGENIDQSTLRKKLENCCD